LEINNWKKLEIFTIFFRHLFTPSSLSPSLLEPPIYFILNV